MGALGLLFSLVCAAAEAREIKVELTVPDAAWSVDIEAIHRVQDELWVVAAVSRDRDRMGAQVISTVESSVDVALPDLPVRYFIVGKTWAWDNAEPYTFLPDRGSLDEAFDRGERLFPSDNTWVLGRTWQWESTVTPVERITVPEPRRYTIRLEETGVVHARLDCNRGRGEYRIGPGKLDFGPLASTRMACAEDSLDSVFVRDLQRVVSFFLDEELLYLELPYDSGTMQFRQSQPE